MPLPPLLRRVDWLARALALLSGGAVALLALLVAFDILSRRLFGFSLQGTDELGGYVLAIVGAFGFGYTLLRRGHPRIDIGFKLFPPRLRDALHVLAYGSITLLAAFMAWHAWGEFGQTLKFGTVTNTPLQTPLALPQGLWLAGSVYFAIVAALCTAHAALLFATAPEALRHHYAPVSIEDEVSGFLDDTLPKGASQHAGN